MFLISGAIFVLLDLCMYVCTINFPCSIYDIVGISYQTSYIASPLVIYSRRPISLTPSNAMHSMFKSSRHEHILGEQHLQISYIARDRVSYMRSETTKVESELLGTVNVSKEGTWKGGG
jgi:hypothetical protein